MGIVEDLLDQAETLARLDPKKPKQASLRRAVSAGYYALFHFLVDQSCKQQVGGAIDYEGARQVLARAFVHGTMKAAFVNAQESRHRADYDLSENFARAEVLADIAAIKVAMKSFAVLTQSKERALFLVSLICFKTLTDRAV